MERFLILLFSLVLAMVYSCQLRSSGTKSSGSAVGSTAVTGTEIGAGSATYYTSTTDGDSLYLACMLYEEQKKRDEWFAAHDLFDSCGYTESSYKISNETYTYTETINGCNDEYAETDSTASTCYNYGDTTQAAYKELSISIKFNLMHKVMLIIQNGVISMQPYYGWYSGIQYAPTISAGAVLGISPLSSSSLGVAVVQERHIVGGIPGSENSCGEVEGHGLSGMIAETGEVAGTIKAHEAKVTVNGTEYNWNWIGFTPFKIPEFTNQYTYSVDCVQNESGDSNNTVVDSKGSTYNNFSYPIHVIYVLNKGADPKKNEGCRTVTVNFDLAYYKTIDSESLNFEYLNSELEAQCTSVLSNGVTAAQ